MKMKMKSQFVRGLAIGVGVVALLGACSSSGSGSDLGDGIDVPDVDVEVPDVEVPDVEVPDVDVPDVEVPDVEVPAPEPDAPAPESSPVELPDLADGSDDGLTTEEVVLLVLLGLAAVALVMGVVSMATNHSDKKKSEASLRRRQIGELEGLGRWILDQGSVEVLRASDAQQLEVAWQTMRPRSIDLETRCSSLASSIDDSEISDTLRHLATDVAALRGALETTVSLRLDPNAAANTPLIDEATRSAYQRREAVQLGLSRLSVMRG